MFVQIRLLQTSGVCNTSLQKSGERKLASGLQIPFDVVNSNREIAVAGIIQLVELLERNNTNGIYSADGE